MTTMAMTVGSGRMTEAGANMVCCAPESMNVPYRTHRSNAVIILERDGSLVRSGPEDQSPAPTSGYTELSANTVANQSNVIDRVLEFAFDTLGLTTLELRVRECD